MLVVILEIQKIWIIHRILDLLWVSYTANSQSLFKMADCIYLSLSLSISMLFDNKSVSFGKWKHCHLQFSLLFVIWVFIFRMVLLFGFLKLLCLNFACVILGYTETLDDDTEIVVPDDDYGLYAIDILDPSLVWSTILSMVFHNSEMM